MPEINANIVVQPYNIDINLTQPGITVTPDVTSLNIYAVGGTNGQPAGNVGDLQYYAANGFAAVPSNVANYTGNTLNLNVTSTKISGGTNGYVLQTDGAGNISWTAQTGGGGNGSPGGSNTQIQYNDSGLFGGSTGFTFNKTSNLVSMPGSLNVAGDIAGANANFTGNITAYTVTANLNGSATTASTVTANAQPNITSLGNLTSLNVFGTAFASVLRTSDPEIALGLDAGQNSQGNRAIAIGSTAGFFQQGADSIAIGNIAGRDYQGSNAIAIGYGAGANNQNNNSIVINATGSNLNTAQANSFFVKPIRNANAGNILFYNQTTGEISYENPAIVVSSISNGSSNVNIPAANGNVTVSVAGVSNVGVFANNGFTVNGNLNINSGTITGNGSGLSNITNSNTANYATTVTGATQSNITAVGTLTDLKVSNNSIHLGFESGLSNAGPYSVGIGQRTGRVNQGFNAVAIGNIAGTSNQGNTAIAIGYNAGSTIQGSEGIAIGNAAGGQNQGTKSVAIGFRAAWDTQGNNSIAIGALAGAVNQHNNTIIINATGGNANTTTANAFFVKPIRNAANTNVVMYNATSGEITYNTLTNYASYVSTISTTVNALVAANSVNSGTRAYVTDGNTTTFYSVIGGGGSNGVPVFSDGTDWRVG